VSISSLEQGRNQRVARGARRTITSPNFADIKAEIENLLIAPSP
jgi:hypothetical protein